MIAAELMRAPQRQRHDGQPDPLPRQLEQKQRQHLQRLAKPQDGHGGQGRQHGVDDAARHRPGLVVKDLRPDRQAKPNHEQKIGGAQQIEPPGCDLGHGYSTSFRIFSTVASRVLISAKAVAVCDWEAVARSASCR